MLKTILARLTLSRKLLVGPTVVVAFLIAIGAIAYLGLRAQRSALDDIYTTRFRTYQDAAAINDLITDAHGSVYKLIAWSRANYDPSKIDVLGKAQMAKVDSAIATIANRAKASASLSSAATYGRALAQATEYRKAVFTVVDFAGVDLNTATMAMGTAEDKYAVLAETLGSLERDEAALSRSAYDGAVASYGVVVTVFLGVFIGALALSLLITLRVNAHITAPVSAMTGLIDVLAGGDLTRELPVESRDELGVMAERLNEMIRNLREMIGGIIEAVATLAGASTQISSSTEEMAAGSQEQTSQASEVASAVGLMARSIAENSTSAAEAASTARKAKEAAERGGQVVQKTVGGMRRIAEVVNGSAATVQTLGKSGDQIGEIISVIDDIADQTNLLALNAAIEAARAGEQGRGFAVVADEVRRLAERTTKATKEIAGMIRTIQSETKGAVSAMNQGTKEVTEGITLADHAGAALAEIVRISQEVTDRITGIAASSEQQSATSEEIAKNVEAIRTVTAETASGEQQIARAAEDLNRLTENLQRLTSRFRLPGTAGAPRAHEPAHAEGISALAVRSNGKIVQAKK
ncbi:MAG TPA: methyl-accepting chemotaxis protein [Bacteroidota bacterium]|nr:methyl-accepting chemotaxis protein [Bacteroidota bacterium]